MLRMLEVVFPVAGGNSNDYLSRVNDGELWEASVYISLVNVPSWGIVLAQPGRVHTTCAEWHSGKDSNGYLCTVLAPFSAQLLLPRYSAHNSSALILPNTEVCVSSDPAGFCFPAPPGLISPAPPPGNCQQEKCGPQRDLTYSLTFLHGSQSHTACCTRSECNRFLLFCPAFWLFVVAE